MEESQTPRPTQGKCKILPVGQKAALLQPVPVEDVVDGEEKVIGYVEKDHFASMCVK